MVKKTTPISKHRNIPEPTIARLPRYLRSFAEFAHNQHTVISSKELAGASGINPAQVRKDLAYFGQFGQRGIGYDVKTLDSKMREILGLHKAWRIALVGCGNLGTALLQYGGFEIAIIAVPASQAQRVADDLVDAGIRAIVNFAPCILTVPKSVLVRGVDLASELEHLTYFLEKSNRTEK